MLCRLDAACTAKQCWNYLRRQLYVMDTYCNAHNRTLNHTMLALHSYLSWAFILPLFLTGLDLAAALPTWSSEVCFCFWMPLLLLLGSLNTKVALKFIHAGPAQLPFLGLCSAPAPSLILLLRSLCGRQALRYVHVVFMCSQCCPLR